MGGSVFIGGGVSELSVVFEGAATTFPGQERDLCILYDHVSDALSGVSFGTPPGFNVIASSQGPNGGGGEIKARSSWKKLEASDIGASITGNTGSVDRKLVLVLRPDEEFDTVTVGSVNQAFGAPPSLQTVTGTGIQGPMLQFCARSLFISSSLAFTTSETLDATVPGVNWHAKFGYILSNAGSPPDLDVSLSGSANMILQSFYLQVS